MEENYEMHNIPNNQINDLSDVRRHYRTTSMHRNVSLKPELTARTLPRTLEDRRDWMEYNGPHTSELEHHADQIAQRMENDKMLNQNNPISEQMRKEALRSMPQYLTVKRQVKDKLAQSISIKRHGKKIVWYKRMKYTLSMKISKLTAKMRSWIYFFEIWYSTLKRIEGHFGSGISAFFKFFRWLFFINFFIMLISLVFIVVPQSTISTRPTGSNPNVDFYLYDIFTGEGNFTNTVLYYGFYSNGYASITGNLKYNMAHAYFLTMIIMYGIYLLIFGMKTAACYKKSYIETRGGLKNVFANKIFCAWDYGVATEEAASLKHVALYQELKEILSDIDSEPCKTEFTDKLRTFFIRLSSNAIILLTISGISYLIWVLLDNHHTGNFKSTGNSVAIAVLINIIILVFPMILNFISKYEYYRSPKCALYINLIRILILEVVFLGILITFWISTRERCWQTSLGQEVYRLIIFDFIVSVLFTLIFQVGRYVVFKYMWKKIGCQEFDIAGQMLQLVYTQTLFWIGFYFSPLLVVIIVLKLFLIWYMKTQTLLIFCKPANTAWRSAQTQTWFLILSLICLVGSVSVLGYVIFYIDSSYCGPLRNGVKDIINVDENVWNIVIYVFKPGFIGMVVVALCSYIYYLRAKGQAQVGVVNTLRQMLTQEAKYKEYLLKRISKVTQGQWQYNLQDGRIDCYDPIRMMPMYNKVNISHINQDNTRENMTSHNTNEFL